MLSLLEIKNIALIDHAKIEFTSGLNVLSGETGAGKSVIIESLNFVLGAKAEKSLIKSGESECFVRAEFENVTSDKINEILSEFEIEIEDTLILTRKLTIDGKGTVKINGVTVTVSMLKKLTALLVDVHGQSEHFYLLKESNQLSLIDSLGGESLKAVKKEVEEYYNEYSKIKKEIDSLGGSEKDRETRLDIINYQINEIESVDLKEGEEEELLALKQRLNNVEKITTALSIAKNMIDSEGGLSDVLYNAIKSVSSVSNLDERYSNLADRLDGISSDLDDVAGTLSDYVEELIDNDLDVDYIEDRLDKIKSLKRKYGYSYQEINEFLDQIVKEKDVLTNFSEIYSGLLLKEGEVKSKFYKSCQNLSKVRKDTSNVLAKNIIEELKELGITKGQFYVDFNEEISLEEFKGNSANGIDRVSFMFSANLGQQVKPLSQVISGGEMSRFMLAVKSQTSSSNELSTFIFDEIDAGISGIIAKVVGKKFAKIAKSVQVIAITHLPQISVMADRNILIFKTEDEKTTSTNVQVLSSEDKINEIIRLIGGDKDSSAAKIHALELINEAEEFKKTI